MSGDNTPLNDADQTAIEHFIDHLWMERGLSDNTLNAYRTDLQGLARWLMGNTGNTLLQADRQQLFLTVRYRRPPTHHRASNFQFETFLSTLDPGAKTQY